MDYKVVSGTFYEEGLALIKRLVMRYLASVNYASPSADLILFGICRTVPVLII